MAVKTDIKTMNVQLIRHIRVSGKMVAATTKVGSKDVATVVTVPESLGRELIANAKAVATKEKANATLPKAETSLEDELAGA